MLEQLKQDRWSQIFLVLVALAGLVACCVVGSGLSALSERKQPRQVEQTLSPIQDIPPGPTNTPLPKSNSLEYRVIIYEKSTILSNAFGEISDLTNHYVDNKNEQDLVTIKENAEIIRSTHLDLIRLRPPLELADFHATLIDATGDCDTAMASLISAIDYQDESEMNKAMSYMHICTEKISKLEMPES